MKVDEMQIGMQIPNSYHSFQIERGEKQQPQDEKDQVIDAEMMTRETGQAIGRVDREEDRLNMNLMDRPVNAVPNGSVSTDNNPMDQSPGAILDIQA